MRSFDLVVIGTGSAAGQIASTCRAAGQSVAIIDSKPFGGTCALRGCDPKKVLVGAASVIDSVERLRGKGVAGDAHIDWAELMRFKRTFTEPVPPSREKDYAEQGIAMFHGRAAFVAKDRIEIDGEQLGAKTFAIAAGMLPVPLEFPGAELLIDSEQFLELDSIPASIVFVGGGYIAFEFAHLAARAGAKVTIIDRGARQLPAFDADLVQKLVEKSRRLGIRIESNTDVERVEHGRVHASGKTFEAELVVHAAGRVPNILDMNLEAAGVGHENKGITVDEFCRTTNPNIFAAGDCANTGNPALTPVAGYEGRVAAANILKPGSAKLTPHVIPSVVFTLPSLARVGLDENQAPDGRAILKDAGHWYSAKRVGEDTSASKIIVENGTSRILGAHLLGPEAEELINVFALAIRCRLTTNDLEDQIFSYPTRGSDVRYMVS